MTEAKKEEILVDIGKNIVWFGNNAESDNLLLLSQKLTQLVSQSATLASKVIDAYALMNESEDEYKIKVDEFIRNFDGSAAKAESHARAEHAGLKRDWTTAKNAYKRFDIILDRVDKICDAIRQRVSVVKQSEMKNL
jgi:hypothetical protein